ncbi:hypothetical protein SAMN05660380_01495 [Xylella fastidiosa]|nr:hypothetical protein SAMN05660380_01495 [Xylella fastidiosa]
MVLKFFQVLC